MENIILLALIEWVLLPPHFRDHVPMHTVCDVIKGIYSTLTPLSGL